MPKRFALPITVLGIFLALALARVMRAPTAVIPQAPPPGAVPPLGPAAPAPPSATKAATPTPPAMHKITMKFDYDFGRSPACSASITANCVQQFNVYDISGGPLHRIKLFSIPVPPKASGQMKGITGTSPQLSWDPGTHFLAVTAQPPTGNESNPVVCMTIVQIKP